MDLTPSRTYLRELGHLIRAEVAAEALPSEETELLFDLYALLALALGASVTAADVHDAWTAWATNNGEKHESAVPFEALAEDAQAEDQPFVDAIRRVSLTLGLPRVGRRVS